MMVFLPEETNYFIVVVQERILCTTRSTHGYGINVPYIRKDLLEFGQSRISITAIVDVTLHVYVIVFPDDLHF